MALEYYHKYGSNLMHRINILVKIRDKDIAYMGEVELEMRLKKKLLAYKLNKNAVRIQSYFRMVRFRRAFKDYMETRNIAALKLQGFWRKYHRW